MSRKILFLINPVSGTKGRSHLDKKIAQACTERKIVFEILPTDKNGEYPWLKEKIDSDHITDVVVCGGDGSLGPVIFATLKKNVSIGIIPLGSGNGLARTAAIPNSINKALDIIFNGKTQRADAFLINNKFSCHVCGLGYDALVAHQFAQLKTRGLQSYTRLAVKNFLAAKPYPFIIETKEGIFNTEAFLICIANSNQFGNNFKVAPRASISDGLLDIVILKKTNKSRIVFSFTKQILFGKVQEIQSDNFHKRDILYFQTDQIKIQNPQNAPLHIDGDPADTETQFTIEVLPSAYKLIQP